jgi:hypothetical protein
VEEQKLTGSDTPSFGSSASISGDIAIVWAWDEDGGEGDPLDQAGAAYIYYVLNPLSLWVGPGIKVTSGCLGGHGNREKDYRS